MKIPAATRLRPSQRYEVSGSSRSRCPRRTPKIGARKIKVERRLAEWRLSRAVNATKVNPAACQGRGGEGNSYYNAVNYFGFSSFGTLWRRRPPSGASNVCSCRPGTPSLPLPALLQGEGQRELFSAVLALEFIARHGLLPTE
jgi:hypothetical protein